MTERAETPGVPIPPPLVPMATFLLGVALDALVGRGSLRAPDLPWLGWTCLFAGVALIATAFRAMVRLGTSVDPGEPARALVTDGPFRFLRNPIYAGFFLTYLGAALALRLLWPLILAPLVPVLLQLVVIRREEAYLERRFGEAYRTYRRRVRRWGIL